MQLPAPYDGPEISPGKLLPWRLARYVPRSQQLGCTASLAMLLGLFSAGMIYGARLEAAKHEDGTWVMQAVGGAFGLFAILLLWAWVRQMLARNVPDTILEISEPALRQGGRFKLAVIQPGPAKLKSLKVNLLCVEYVKHWPKGGSGDSSNLPSTRETFHVQEMIFDAGEVEVFDTGSWQRTMEFTVPTTGLPTEGAKNSPRWVRWRMEVWVKNHAWGSLMHPMEVVVGKQEGE